MSVIRNLVIRAGADFSQMRREMQRANDDMKKFKNHMRSAVAGITAALGGIAVGMSLKSGIEDAIKFEALMGTLSKTLGKSADDFVKWQNTVGDALGFSKLQVAEMGNNYSLRLKSIAKDEKDLFDKTTALIKAAAVIRSKTGMSSIEISDRMRSAMNQEADGADELGVNVRVAAIQQSKAYKELANNAPWEQLSEQMKKTILYHHILDSTTSNFGTEIANNTALLKGGFVSALSDAKLALGQAFLPILNIVLPLLTQLARAAETAFKSVAGFMRTLFPKSNIKAGEAQTAAIDSQAGAVGSLGDAYKDAGKAAKGALAGFDEINNISDSGSGEDAASAGAGANMPTGAGEGSVLDTISTGVQAAANKIREIFSGLSSFIKEHKDVIVSALGSIAFGFATFLLATNWSAIIGGIATAFNILKVSIVTTWAAISWPITLIAIGVAALIGAFIYFYRTNEKFKGVVDGILKAIADTAVWLWNDVLVPLGKWLGTVFVAAWEGLKVAAEWFWKKVMIPLGDFLLWFWSDVIVPVSGVLGDLLGKAFSGLSEVAKSFWQNVMIPLGNFFKDVLGPTVEALSAVFEWLWKNVLQPLGEYLGKTLKQVFSDLTDVIVYLWQNVLEPLVKFVGGGLKTTLITVFESIGKIIDGLKTAFIGVMTFITGVFTSDWEKAWNGVKDIFEGVFKSLYAIVKTPLDLIVNAINAVIDGLNGIKFDLPAWMGGGKFGLSLPKMAQLPSLDVGTNYVQSSGLAMIHEGEAVVPKKYNPAAGGADTDMIDRMASAIGTAVLTAMQMGGGNSKSNSGDINLSIDGTAIARVIVPYLNKENSRIGGSMITAASNFFA
ncbi:phage tail protein [Paenibacillus sp. Soil750]|uniref:phage tail protein n=1 Tax=Paenibacillus sp. Soil750 TaxID=1736398 RepID=UPI0006F8CABF|nr:hypothetical protein [Paenibacillus sp. Soil750]KRE70770.1 hypothetical protein ASL11_10775 [Paenibacillus sp. Soil750]